MAARKKATEKDFWTKMLSGNKVRRILEKRGFDAEAFRKDYEADNNRAPRKSPRPSEKEIDGVEAFMKSGNYDQFLKALGTQSRPKADSALRRVVAWKGRGGIKTIRRRTGE